MSEEKEQYVVSARKYRPQTFDTVIGQQHITTTLKNAIRSGHLAHAYLFCGPRGVGKTTCARILARTLNCENPTENMEACGECSTCQAFKTNSALNIFELDAASNNSVEDIRRLTEQVRYAPQHGKYKIYIIDEVHMLSSAAFNAFLKTLEEPPSYAIFILATTEKHKILPTILSRCQIFDFRRIKPNEIVHHLEEIIKKEGLSAEEGALHIIAQKSEGCMRDALSMMDRLVGFSDGNLTYDGVIEHLSILDATTYFTLSEFLLTKDIAGTLLLLDELLQKGFEGDLILNGFSEHFRNLLLCREPSMAQLLEIPEAHKKQYYQHAQLLSDSYLLSALSVLNDAELSYKSALNKRLHVELCLIKLSYLNDLISPNAFPAANQETNELKKKFGQRTEPVTVKTKSEKEVKPEVTSVTKPAAPKRKDTFFEKSAVEEQSLVQEPIGVDSTDHPSVLALPKLKTGNDYLNTLREKISRQEEVTQIALSADLAKNLFAEFCEKIHDTDLILAKQMEVMKIHFQDAEELHLICNSKINYTYGQAAAKQFRTYVRKKTGQPHLRIIAVLDTTIQAEPVQQHVKSKLEIIEGFMEKNPSLKILKSALGLTIEY